MTPLHELRIGQRIHIAHPTRGECPAVVLHVETPANLPSISGAPEINRVREILAEREVQQLALLSYQYAGIPVSFVAFGNGAGRWWDMRQQDLTITEPHP